MGGVLCKTSILKNQCEDNGNFSLLIFFFSLILGLLNAVCNGALLYIGVPAGPCCYRNINSSRQFFHHQGERLKRQACIGKSVCGGC